MTGPTATGPDWPHDVAVAIRLRPISAQDKDALIRFHDQLSDDTKFRRYHAAKKSLSTADLNYFTEVDQQRHLALVAHPDDDEHDLLGVARAVAMPGTDDEAEIAVVVRDDHHGSGVGADLIEAVVDRAERAGMRRVVAEVQADNHRALRLFQGFGFRQRAWDGGVRELVRDLGDERRPSQADPRAA